MYLIDSSEFIFDADGYLISEDIDDIIRKDQILSTVDNISLSSEDDLEMFVTAVVKAWTIYRKMNKKNLDSLSKFDSIIKDIYLLYK